MSEKNLLQERDELLEAVKAPARKKSPSNNSLYFAIIAADVIFSMLDIGSGLTVYWLTGIWFYGVLVFLAGVVPLLLFQKLFSRAFASNDQKKIAIGGALLAVFSILGIGVLAGVANVSGVGNINSEMAVVLLIVVLAFVHAILLTWYFYIDEGIQADQTVAQTLARAMRQSAMIEAGDHVLDVTSKSVKRRDQIGSKHGSKAALVELLHQMGWDDNENGIPDWLEKHDKSAQQQSRPMVVNAQNVERVQERKEEDFTNRPGSK